VQPTAASALAAKQNLLEKHISEQKALMAAFSATAASTEEKKRIMDRLRALGKEMEETKASATAIPASVLKKAPSAMVAEMERERLDKELENRGGGGGGETTEELKAKLEKLKAEAASLGIADGAEASYGGGFRGGYRGRVRGTRGGYNYRGGPVLRGAPPRGSMKLDNRPKRLLVKGVPSGEEGVQAVKDWFSSTSQVDSIESADEGVAVAFQSRAAAEQVGLCRAISSTNIDAQPIGTCERLHSSHRRQSIHHLVHPQRETNPLSQRSLYTSGSIAYTSAS
jgi:RNA-binding protein 26